MVARVPDRDAQIDRTKKIPNKNVWTAFVKSSEVNARASWGPPLQARAERIQWKAGPGAICTRCIRGSTAEPRCDTT